MYEKAKGMNNKEEKYKWDGGAGRNTTRLGNADKRTNEKRNGHWRREGKKMQTEEKIMVKNHKK